MFMPAPNTMPKSVELPIAHDAVNGDESAGNAVVPPRAAEPGHITDTRRRDRHRAVVDADAGRP